MNNKMLFNAIEAELRNARTAINNASDYLDAVQAATNTVVLSESWECFLPIGVDSEDKTVIYGLKIKDVNTQRESVLPAI